MKAILFLLPFALLLLSAHLVVYNPLAYKTVWFFLGSESKEASQIIKYFIWQKNLSLEVAEKERQHIADVKRLLQWMNFLFAICFLLSFLVVRREKLAIIRRAAKYGLWALVPLCIILLLFNYSFASFHKVFFPQGNYLFSPDSLLITLFPEQFFLGMLLLIIIIYAIACLATSWFAGKGGS